MFSYKRYYQYTTILYNLYLITGKILRVANKIDTLVELIKSYGSCLKRFCGFH